MHDTTKIAASAEMNAYDRYVKGFVASGEKEDEGDLEGAIKISKEMLKIAPDSAPTMNTIAGLYGKLGKFQAAVTWATKATSQNPEYYQGYINLGNNLALSKKIDQAKLAYINAMEIHPNEPLAVYSLGVLHEGQKNYEEAIWAYKAAIKLDTKFENAYYNLAAVYTQKGQFKNAAESLKSLLKINPKDQQAKDFLKFIESKSA